MIYGGVNMRKELSEENLREVISEQYPTVGDDSIDAFLDILYFFSEG